MNKVMYAGMRDVAGLIRHTDRSGEHYPYIPTHRPTTVPIHLPTPKACIDDGLLLVAAGPTVVRFVPPLIVTEAEVDEAVRR